MTRKTYFSKDRPRRYQPYSWKPSLTGIESNTAAPENVTDCLGPSENLFEGDSSDGGMNPFDDEEGSLEQEEQNQNSVGVSEDGGEDDLNVLVNQLLQIELDNIDEDELLGEETLEEDEVKATPMKGNPASHSEGYTMEFTNSDRAMLDMIECCNKAGTPINFLDNFLRVLKKHVLHNDFDVLKAPKRSTFMNKLRKGIPSPSAIPAQTRSGLMLLKYPFLDQLIDLLSSSYTKHVETCNVNSDQAIRWDKYIPLEEEGLSEVSCASWYRETYLEKIGNNKYHVDEETGKKYRKFLMDIQLYNDKTGVGAIDGKYTLESHMFSTGFIRRTFRQNADAWRHLGFIPNYHKGLGEEEEKDSQKSLATFHEIMEVFLADLVHCQKNPPCLTLKLFGETVDLCLILEVSFVIGDQLSQDHHCCRKKVNGGGAGRVHRRCMASFLSMSSSTCSEQVQHCKDVDKGIIDRLSAIVQVGESDSKRSSIVAAEYPVNAIMTLAETRLTQKKRDSLSAWLRNRATLSRDIFERVFGMYPVMNAWDKVSFGSNKNGILRATLDDLLHYSSSGLFAYENEVSFKGLVPSEARKIERFLREDCVSNRCSVKYDLPRPRLAPGFTSCAMITANEKVGQVFTLYFGLATKRIQDVYNSCILRQQGKYIDLESVYQSMGYKKKKGRPPRTQLPRFVDQYFFSDLKKKKRAEMNNSRIAGGYEILRTPAGSKRLIEGLDSLDLLFVMDILPQLDKLQVEYLIHGIWSRCCRNGIGYMVNRPIPTSIPTGLYPLFLSVASTKEARTALARSLHRCFEKKNRANMQSKIGGLTDEDERCGGEKEETDDDDEDAISSTPTVRAKINKHFLKKPVVKGTGETCAFLTDINGIRSVFEHSLILNAILQEHHQLRGELQRDLSLLSNRIQHCLDVITQGIYRGDNSVDCCTCKMHAHCHIVQDIAEYGSPSNYDATLGERGLKIWAKLPGKSSRKCGETTFITQVASRISDNQILSKARRLMDSNDPQQDDTVEEKNVADIAPWSFGRNNCHMIYHLGRKEAWYNEKGEAEEENASCRELLLPQVVKKLHSSHGSTGLINIWKEVKVSLGKGQGDNYVRAYHTFDSYAPYFDWVSIKDDNKEGDESYVPAKALLLYEFENKGYCLCWRAKTAEPIDHKHETNISARWRMAFDGDNNLPLLISVRMENVHKTLWVYQHFRSSPQFPQGPTTPEMKRTYTVEEAYTRYEWALNFLDKSRWEVVSMEETEDVESELEDNVVVVENTAM